MVRCERTMARRWFAHLSAERWQKTMDGMKRLPIFAAFALCVAACSGRQTPAVPVNFAQFQHVQNTAAGALSNSPGTTVYTLGDGGSNAHQVEDMRIGADGKMYYTTGPDHDPPMSGEVGNFDFATHKQTYQTVAYWPAYLDETAHGLWVEEANNISGQPTIDHYSGIGGTDTAIPIPIATAGPGVPFNGIFGGLSTGADSQVWFGASWSAQAGEINQSTNAVKVYALPTPFVKMTPNPYDMALGADNHLWMTDVQNDGVYRITSGGANKGSATYTVLPPGLRNAAAYGLASGSDHKMYVGFCCVAPLYSGALDKTPEVAAPNFSTIAMPAAPVVGIDVLSAAPGKMYFNEFDFGGLGVYDIKTGSVTILPLSTFAIDAILTDPSGNPWLGCMTTSGVACIERVVIPSKWQVYPSTSVTLYTEGPHGKALPPGLIGIGETGNSSPFKVTSSNTGVCTASMIAGFTHDIEVNPVSAGTCTLAVTDAHSRTVDVTVTVVSGKGSPQARVNPGGAPHDL